jgi:hypothetical protein
MAAIHSARAGARTTLIEANTTSGRKLLLTGGGRCNLTHKSEPKELVRAFGDQGRFLSFCLYEYPPQFVLDFFAGLGLQTKVQEDGCVFPVSERAGDVRDALVNQAKTLGVKFLYDKRVGDITKDTDAFTIRTPSEPVSAKKIIIATGGLSWPKTGCTGDGYRFARQFGHSIIEPKASLVPLVTQERWPAQLAGTAVEKVRISTHISNNKIHATGALVFTEDGIGGPAVWDMSRYITDYLPAAERPVTITLDLLPDFNQAEFEKQINDLAGVNPKKKVVNIVAELLPRRLATFLCGRADCNDELVAGQLKKDIRKKLIAIVKSLPLSIVRTRPIEEAIVTRGGVSINEVDPKTMESKICPGMYFVGEVLDVDGPCGGFSLQICFSTAALAGTCASQGR